MFQYRIVLAQMRRGDSEREIARSHCMGRHKLAALRALAEQHGWLDAQAPLPEDAQIAAALGAPKLARPPSRRSSRIASSSPAGSSKACSGTTILAALRRKHGYQGSYSSRVPHDRAIRGERPPDVTVPLELRARRGRPGRLRRRPDADPSRRRAAAHLGVRDDAVLQPPPVRRVRLGPDGGDLAGLPPPRLRMVRRRARAPHHRQPQVRDHQACIHDPLVQRAYAECAEGYGFKIDPCPPRDPQKKGIVEAGRQVRQGQLPAAARSSATWPT